MLSKKYLIFIALLPYVMYGNCCPDKLASLISPCTFSTDLQTSECQIKCGGNENADLGEIFEKLSAKLDPGLRHFYRINITNTAITELKENTFKDFWFNYIAIDGARQLKLIHTNAFAANNRTKGVNIKNNPHLLSNEGHSVFDMSRRFSQLTSFVLNNNDLITEIPAQALKGIPTLLVVSISGTGIKTLGEGIFDGLDALTDIEVVDTNVERIPVGVFSCKKSSFPSHKLAISSSSMTGASFANGSLSALNCPTILFLTIPNAMKKFTYMEESVFLPFYKANTQNSVDSGPVLDCEDCRNHWLVQRPEVTHARVSALECTTGRVNDNKNFSKCK